MKLWVLNWLFNRWNYSSLFHNWYMSHNSLPLFESDEYIISRALLSLRSTAGRTSRILLADVIPWINKPSLVLYIARTLCAMPQPTRYSKLYAYIALLISTLVIENCQCRDRESASLQLRRWHRCSLDCVCTILTTFYHMNHYGAIYWACGQVFITSWVPIRKNQFGWPRR